MFDLAHELLPDLPVRQAYNILHNRVERALIALNTLLAAGYLPERQTAPQAFYTAPEIEQLYGADHYKLRYWVNKGQLVRYPAPAGLRSGQTKIVHVYDKEEVDRLCQRWQPRRSKKLLHARRQSGNAQEQTLDAASSSETVEVA